MFYIIVLIIAIILLIVGLILVGVSLTRGSNTEFPDYKYSCPDFWDVSGTLCIPSSLNVNIPSADKFKGDPSFIQHTGVSIMKSETDKRIVNIDTSDAYWSGTCDKGSWAKRNGIFWDGVANNNKC
jgi:hypothetical protein